jgi:hypothetical protein
LLLDTWEHTLDLPAADQISVTAVSGGGSAIKETGAMAWIFDLVGTFGLCGSLALLAWGAAVCLEEAFTGGHHEADAHMELPASVDVADGRTQ